MTMFSLVAVLALASMGLTYTLWSETLEIDGTVNTGSVDVSISGGYQEFVGVETGGVYSIVAESTLPVEKNTANCAVEGAVGVGAEHLGDTVNTGDGELDVTVTGAYPSYYCVVTVTVTNEGTVPVHVNLPELAATSTTGITGIGSLDDYNANIDVDGDGALDDAGCYTEDVQLHTGDTASCAIIIHFTNSDNLDEGTAYDFNFTILAHQWNEEA